MTAIARLRKALLPGNRASRVIARLPKPAQVGSLRVDLDRPHIATIDDPFIGEAAPQVSSMEDLTPSAQIQQITVPPLLSVDIVGTIFEQGANEQRGTALDMPPPTPQNARPPSAESRRWRPHRRPLGNVLALLLPVLLPPPLGRTGTVFEDISLPHSLYKFQQAGIEFLRDTKPGALLADDMGLGKTVQAIVALRLLIRHGFARRALVVAPNSVITSWQRHFTEWAPELLAYRIQGEPRVRQMLWRAFAEHRFHVGIIPYRSFTIDQANDLTPDVDVLIVDEAQNIKNPQTQQSQALAALNTRHRWALTGTPLENKLSEMAAILRFVDRGSLPRPWDRQAVRIAAQRLMLRRRKEAVLEDLPRLTSNVVYVELTSQQQREYDRAEREGVTELYGKPRNIANVLALITSLKQICNSFNGYSAKRDWLYDYAREAVEERDKLLVFSQYLRTLDEIERDFAGYRPMKFTGALSGRARDETVDAFQDSNSRHEMMLLQVKAGGLGLTLTAANRVVHFDSWWNPAVQSQATARAHRIGQQKTVFESTLVSTGTIEERIQDLLDSKRELFEHAVDDLSVDGMSRLLTRDELYGLFENVRGNR